MELDIQTKPKVDHKKASPINLYRTTPFGQLTLEECQDLFMQRLEALNILEKSDLLQTRDLSNVFRGIKSHAFKTNCIILGLGDDQRRKWDHYSHMLMRLYCAYQPAITSWFKTMEKKLFNYRIRDHAGCMSGDQLAEILKSFNFDFERVKGQELETLIKEELIGWNKGDADRRDSLSMGSQRDIFKVKIADAIKFISRRSVSLKNGLAYLTKNEIIILVCDVFDEYLEKELNYARINLNVDHLQTQFLLDSLDGVYADFQMKVEAEKKASNQRSHEQNPYKIHVNEINDITKKHFPPCMRHLQESLSQDHHLKHQARLYYGSFLRSGGVDMETAIEFWRQEFTKKIPRDKFDQNYKYNIRHLYGMEGHKKALSCFSCDKIINDNRPGPGDKHGCPFKEFDSSHLRTMLSQHGLKDVDIESIFLYKNQEEHKLACSHYFKFLKGELPSEPIKNPIHFYYESMRLANRPPPDEEMKIEGEKMEDIDFE